MPELDTTIGVQNSITLASATPEIWLVSLKFTWFTWPDNAPFRYVLSYFG